MPNAKLELTPGEVRAVAAALDYFLSASSEEECLQVFRSAQGVDAAGRASEKLTKAGNAPGVRAFAPRGQR